MSCFSGPQSVSSNLVFESDPVNSKSYDTATNLFTYSEDFGNAAWTKGNLTVTSNATTGPIVNGVVLVADKLVETAVSGQHLIQQNPYTAAVGDINTISVYAKAGERTQLTITSQGEGYVVFNLDTGTVYQNGGESASIEDVGGGWYRCRATITENEAAGSMWYIGMWKSNTNSYLGTVGQGLYIAGAQFEKNRNAITPYTKTIASTVVATTTLTDMIGNGNNTTLVNTPKFDSTYGGSLVLNGTNQYLTNPALPSGTNLFTMSIWVYFNGNISGNWGGGLSAAILFSGNGANTYEFYVTTLSGTGAPYYLTLGKYGIAATGSCSVSNIIMPINRWHNIVIARDGAASQQIYLNGELIGTGNISDSFTAGTMYIGAAPANSLYSGYLNGQLSKITHYNRALSSDEIQQNFNALRGRYGI